MATIFLIEDNPADFHTIHPMLSFAGHTVEHHIHAQDALAALEQGSGLPDVLISNLIMPGLDGFLLARQVKQTPELAAIPVILLAPPGTESGDEGLARRAGAVGLLRKPLVRDHLLSEIDRAVLSASVQANPLSRQTATEELSYLRDYNQWLSRMMQRMHRDMQHLETRTTLREAHLGAIHHLTTALGRTLDIHETAATLVQKTAELVRAQAVAIFDAEEDLFTLRHVMGYGIPTPQLVSAHRLDLDSPLFPIAELEQVMLFNTPARVEVLQETLGLSLLPGSAIVSPLVARRALTGFLVALRLGVDAPFSEADAEMIVFAGRGSRPGLA
ncbi:MAG: response regulator [Anaerolineae bacterium]|nr:response regulator [Anaerolineae bacterium]